MADPKRAEAYNNRGTAYASKGNYEHAIADYDQALELNPGFTELFANRGLAYVKTGQPALAIDDFSAALSKNPKDAHSMYNRGVAKQVMGDQTGADVVPEPEIAASRLGVPCPSLSPGSMT